MLTIPLAVTARNEEQSIGSCLQSLLASVEHAEAALALKFEVTVVLDGATDRTEEIVRPFSRVSIVQLEGEGNIVEAQRRANTPAPFMIYSDADISIEPPTLAALGRTMLEHPEVRVAYPAKSPLRPSRKTLLAEALYTYNRFDGFQTPRRYFNGKLFAIREWHIPDRDELRPRLREMSIDRFYDFHAGMRVDDIYLSRDILRRHGPAAIREVSEGRIRYRPPETFEGMYRTYRRMRMEIERLDTLFPETREVHRRYGIRGYDWTAVRQASRRDRWLWRAFRVALAACKTRYALERSYYRHLARERKCPAWEPINESKRPISSD